MIITTNHPIMTIIGMIEINMSKHRICPICESPFNEEIERYVQSELYKMIKDPSYIPVTWSKRDK